MSDFLQQFHRAPRGHGGIYSVCSAHHWVIEAAMHQAKLDGTHLLLEATSNQVHPVEAAAARLIQNLQQTEIPETLFSQYCPQQYDAVRAGRLGKEPKELVIANVRTVLDMYSNTCQNDGSNHQRR